MREQWQKLAALAIYRLPRPVRIEVGDIDAMTQMFGGEMCCIVVQEKDGAIELDLVPESKAIELARADELKRRNERNG